MCVCVCVCVCPGPESVNNKRHDMDPYDWLNTLKFYSFYMTTLVVIISRCSLRIEVCHRNNCIKAFKRRAVLGYR